MRRRRYGAKSKPKVPFYLRAVRFSRKASSSVIPLALLVAIGGELHHFVHTQAAFDLSEVEVRTNGSLDKDAVLDLIQESNIFKIDLLRLTQRLEARPEVRSARVTRSLPDSLIVDVVERIPVAQMRANRYFLVDEEGVILPGARDYPDPDLPVIVGIGLMVGRIKPGEPYCSDRLNKALELLEAISPARSLKDRKVTRIDVRDLRDIYFLTDEEVEVRVGGEDFDQKIRLMDEVLLEARSKGENVKYIDLRFGDVVVGWK